MTLTGCGGCSHMTQKLFTFVAGECTAENPDNPMFQEALLSGHLYQMVLKVRHVTLGGLVDTSTRWCSRYVMSP